MRKQTNIIFFQQDLVSKPNGDHGYNTISRSIENSYNTLCYCLEYHFNERLELAGREKKKFGFVLTKLK